MVLRITALLAAVALAAACGDSTEPLVPSSIEIDPAVVEFEVAQSATLTARILDQHGDVMDPPPEGTQLTWSSSSTSIVRVEDGVITGTGPGTATITATAGTLSGESAVSVDPRELTGSLAFEYAGGRSGSFSVSSTFRLFPDEIPEWALTFYYAAEGGQDILAYQVREDESLDHLRFWIDADAQIETAGTYDIDGGYAIFRQVAPDAWEALYADFVEGTVTITSADADRLVGTFELVLRNEIEAEIEVTSGTFDIPVVQETELSFGSPAGAPGTGGPMRVWPRR